MLPKYVELPLVLFLQLARTNTNLVSVLLIALVRMSSGHCPIAAIQVNRKVAENAHWQLTYLPANLPRHIEYQQTVDAGLILSGGRCVGYERSATLIVDIKRVTIPGIIIEGWRELGIKLIRKCKFPADLPAEHIGIVVWNELPRAITRRRRPRPDRILRVLVVVNKLSEVCEQVG